MRRLSLIWIGFALYLSDQVFAQSGNPGLRTDVFSHPEVLCSALEENGIHTGQWKQIGSGFFNTQIEPSPHSPYSCEYPVWTAAPHVGGPTRLQLNEPAPRPSGPDITTIYRVSGDSAKRADIVSIAVTVHRPSALDIGKTELNRDITQLFKTINRQAPAGLFESIERQRYFRSRQPYGVVWFDLVKRDHHKTDDQVLWFRLQE